MINQVHTSCRDCAFAEYTKGTQVGCEFNRIESYKNSGAEVLEAYDENGKEKVPNVLYNKDYFQKGL